MAIKKEYREMEVRAATDTDEMIVEGYAIRFNDKTVLYEIDGIEYSEIIDSRALDTTDLKDVPFKYNHSSNFMIMARTRNKTLELTVDEQGLFIRAKLAPTSAGKDLYQLIKRGDVDKMSFGFTSEEDEYDRTSRTRTVMKIKKLWDVSAVDDPAYANTSIQARNFFEAQRETELRAKEEKRKALLIKTYL